MKFKLEFDMDTDAFDSVADPEQPGLEIQSILRRTAKQVEEGNVEGYIRATNGHTVGHWEIVR